jgi:phospholipid transport system substrate-binding protein
MQTRFLRFPRALVALVLTVAAASAFAVAQTPDQLVTQTTERVLSVAREAKSYYDKDPQRLNRQVDDIMSDVVDFDGFARGVMGVYASEQRYRALKTDAERAAFRARIAKFTDIFRQGLIDTYAKGLLKFNGQRIETVGGRSSVNGVNATVVQNIHGDAAQPYVIQYTLRQDKSGVWKLRNVIIEGVNLGLTYRNQFAASAQQYGGDLDKVIANWRVEPDVKPADGAAKGAQ